MSGLRSFPLCRDDWRPGEDHRETATSPDRMIPSAVTRKAGHNWRVRRRRRMTLKRGRRGIRPI